ncbi:MAG TPA: hypothetical protein VFW07_28375 [Parafilimonas sp.]|nr:hypothetical protein [Parafilimonas sp.]
MNQDYEKILATELASMQAPEFLSQVDKDRFNESIVRMIEMQTLLRKAIYIIQNATIPLGLLKDFEGIATDYNKLINLIDSVKNPNNSQNISKIFESIRASHLAFFEISSSNRPMAIINSIRNYEPFFDENSIKRFTALNTDLENKNKRAEEILSKLEKPSAERVLSNYAEEYKKEELKNNKKSNVWLIAGIGTTAVFINLIIFSIFLNWFPSKLTLFDTKNHVQNSHEIINIPVLLIKALLISLIIYFIVFSFKQYSIHKHLAVTNQQKKNAFDSYTLFAAAVGENDIEAKKILLMSLAKTIHESINTGFISSKQNDQPLIQNVDVGKLLTGQLGSLNH